MYISINTPQGGGVDIPSFSGKKPGVRRKLSWTIGKVKEKDSIPEPQYEIEFPIDADMVPSKGALHPLETLLILIS